MHAKAMVDFQSEPQAQQELLWILLRVHNLVRRLGNGPPQRSRNPKAEMTRKVVHGNALRRDHLRIQALLYLFQSFVLRSLYEPIYFHCSALWLELEDAVSGRSRGVKARPVPKIHVPRQSSMRGA